MGIYLIIGVITIGTMSVPAFATSNEWSSYSCGDAVPNGWSSDNDAYASVDYSTGYSDLYTTSPSGGNNEMANTDMDYEGTNDLCDTAEQLTTSASTIYWGYDADVTVSITNNGGTAEYTTGANLYSNAGSGWGLYDSCGDIYFVCLLY